MRWTPRGRSRNLEDRRAGGFRRGRAGLGRGGVRLPIPSGRKGGIGLGGIVLVLAVSYFLGINPLELLSSTQVGLDSNSPFGHSVPEVSAGGKLQTTAEEEKLVDFVSFVIDDLQASWTQALPGYRDAKLVLFRGATQSGCGTGQSEMGPFYCPRDQKVYIDLSFYSELRDRFGAPGDFAQAYVLAHEIGHHVQQLSGISDQVRRQQSTAPSQKNALSVRLELQADCLAGVWAHGAGQRKILEPGDVEEGMRAAAAIGDDRIGRMSGRGVHPDSFTHGSSEQRMQWLRRGLQSGNADACDTFGSAS